MENAMIYMVGPIIAIFIFLIGTIAGVFFAVLWLMRDKPQKRGIDKYPYSY